MPEAMILLSQFWHFMACLQSYQPESNIYVNSFYFTPIRIVTVNATAPKDGVTVATTMVTCLIICN